MKIVPSALSCWLRYAEVPKSGFKKLDRRRALSISTPSSPMLDEGPWEASHAPLGFGDEALNGIRGGDASDSNRRNKVVELSEGVGQSPAEEDVTGDEMGAGLSLPVPEGAKSAAGVDRLDPRSDPAGLLDPDDFRNQRWGYDERGQRGNVCGLPLSSQICFLVKSIRLQGWAKSHLSFCYPVPR